jgi:hypothetical protein
MSTSANVAAELAIQYRERVVQTISCMGSASNVAWTVSADEFRRVFEAAMNEFCAQCGPRLAQALTGSATQ